MKTEEEKINEAINYLNFKGYYVNNLWHIDDVKNKFKCTDDEAFEILDAAVAGEYIIEEINSRIIQFSRQNGLKSKKD